MAKLMLKRIQASTLLEVIISMVIIMAVFVVAMGIYTKVTLSGISLSKIKAQHYMKRIIDESIQNRDWEDAVSVDDSIEYKKSVSVYAGYEDRILITVEAVQQGRSLGDIKQIVEKQEYEN